MSESQLIKADTEMKILPNDTELLIMGNSHSLALLPAHLRKASNISSYGERIHQSYYKLDYVLNSNIKPHYVVLNYDLGQLRDYSVDNQNYQFYWNNLENLKELLQFSDKRAGFIFNRLISFISPYHDGETEMFDFFFARGDTGKLRDKDVDMSEVTTTSMKSDSCLEEQFGDLPLYFFDKLLERIVKEDIQLILVRFPVTRNYFLSQSTCYSPLDYYSRLLSKMINKNDNIRVLDYHDVYNDGYFRDPHHLAGESIRVSFTQKFSLDLDSIANASGMH
ncbi:MAG: hypothetical protein GY816_05685 [Cytophagales bacterium]|nr:hypothetical protein [Cytophagales bacterium]